MEEVSAHVHPGPIVPDALTRKHEHRFGHLCRTIFGGAPTDRGSPSGTSDLGLVVWYRDITRVGNPTYRDTRTIAYQPIGVDRRIMQEVDDMAIRVLEGLPLSLTQYASFARKVQTIIHRCMVSIGGTLGYTPSQHDIQ
ncbi:hypothetical protein M9H77_01975 [Catharanthus roseus]|uniref:Uncharacterized protein n=1 Tax=Catharanthus roseus TaxID=4058 RepID=A0ACC0C7H2_CATRO|nr:hypothetical protein M9H77_01975 [Catharanthus roseus]